MRAVGVGKKGSRQQDVKANAHWSVSDAEKNIMMLKIITIIKKMDKNSDRHNDNKHNYDYGDVI